MAQPLPCSQPGVPPYRDVPDWRLDRNEDLFRVVLRICSYPIDVGIYRDSCEPNKPWNGVTGHEDIGYDGSIATSGYSALGHKAISGDGRFVAFYSSKPNIVAGDNNGFFDVRSG
jgi:hypothetical protein